MNRLAKRIQELPESKRKIIFWVTIIILGLGLFCLNIINFQKRLKNFKIEKIKEQIIPSPLKEPFKELPKIEIPK
jgi:hypothetical protein